MFLAFRSIFRETSKFSLVAGRSVHKPGNIFPTNPESASETHPNSIDSALILLAEESSLVGCRLEGLLTKPPAAFESDIME